MQKNKTDWREKAVSYLTRHTSAMIDEIEHYVTCLWIEDYSKEENLSLFKEYHSEVTGALSA